MTRLSDRDRHELRAHFGPDAAAFLDLLLDRIILERLDHLLHLVTHIDQRIQHMADELTDVRDAELAVGIDVQLGLDEIAALRAKIDALPDNAVDPAARQQILDDLHAQATKIEEALKPTA